MNQLSLLDKICLNVDKGLRFLSTFAKGSGRVDPDHGMPEPTLSKKERRISTGLMRVNHAGEVSAQALYLGQGLTARLTSVRGKMMQAASEEVDHLNWCKRRLSELNSHTSFLNPIWFAGSFVLGAAAGAIGDKWSLGFVAETERQVVKHLEEHMIKMSDRDDKSQRIITQMRDDESRHQAMAINAGAAEFPQWIKAGMQCMSRVMTTTAYWV